MTSFIISPNSDEAGCPKLVFLWEDLSILLGQLVEVPRRNHKRLPLD